MEPSPRFKRFQRSLRGQTQARGPDRRGATSRTPAGRRQKIDRAPGRGRGPGPGPGPGRGRGPGPGPRPQQRARVQAKEHAGDRDVKALARGGGGGGGGGEGLIDVDSGGSGDYRRVSTQDLLRKAATLRQKIDLERGKAAPSAISPEEKSSRQVATLLERSRQLRLQAQSLASSTYITGEHTPAYVSQKRYKPKTGQSSDASSLMRGKGSKSKSPLMTPSANHRPLARQHGAMSRSETRVRDDFFQSKNPLYPLPKVDPARQAMFDSLSDAGRESLLQMIMERQRAAAKTRFERPPNMSVRALDALMSKRRGKVS